MKVEISIIEETIFNHSINFDFEGFVLRYCKAKSKGEEIGGLF